MPLGAQGRFKQKCQELLQRLEQAEHDQRRIIVLDEIVFTKRSILQREYSGKNTNLSIDQADIYTGYRKVIATMNRERGIGYTQILAEGIDSEIFLKFLKELRRRMP